MNDIKTTPAIKHFFARSFWSVLVLIFMSLLMQACGGASNSGTAAETTITLDTKPSLFFIFNSKKDTNSAGKDTYYYFIGETIDFPRHIFSNSAHTSLDVSKSYWADSNGTVIQDNNSAFKVTDQHKPLVKACMVPKLSNGESNAVTCVDFEVRDLPSLSQKLKKVSTFTDSDHFQAGIQLTELENNDIRSTEGTVWQYRWFDKDSNLLEKSGDMITGYKLDYVDIDNSIKQVKVCVFEIASQQCIKESALEIVPSNNVPIVTILDITGEYKLGGKISPESRTSYEYTKPAANFTYEWTVDGVMLTDAEKTASELILKEASYFEKDIQVCMQRAYRNFTGVGTTLTDNVCKIKQFKESDVQVTGSYYYGDNLLVQGAPWVYSGKFNGIDAIDYSTFKLKYQGKVLVQNTDYSITTFSHNDFTFKIHSQKLEAKSGYGPIFTLQCEFSYNSKLYSCIGASNSSDTISIYTHSGLPEMQSKVIGAIAEKNRVAFKECAAGDKLTWWLKDKGSATYVQTGTEEVIEAGDICYGGNNPDGSIYLNESWAGKSLKLILKRARNGLSDKRIQVVNIELGEISK